MLLGARQFFAARKAAPALPYDAEVQWMSSDGQSYFVTDYIPPETQRFKVSYTVSSYSKQCYFGCGSGTSTGLPTDSSWCVLGASGNSDRRFSVRIRPDRGDWVFWCNRNVGNEYFDGTSTITVDAPIANARTNPNIKINGTSYTFPTVNYSGDSGAATIPVAIFGRNSPSGMVLPATSDFKFRELIFFGTNDETEPLAHFVPVRVGSVGKIYNKISGNLLAGSGAFTIGPDK